MLIPETEPVFRGLNSYYVDVTKLLEYFRSSNATGCIRISSIDSSGIVFYSNNTIINPVCNASGKTYYHNDAISAIKKIASIRECKIDVYAIDENQIFLWANLSKAQTVYDNLTTDLTDLGKLLRKVETEKITGVIEVAIKNGTQPALMLFYKGLLVGTHRPGVDDRVTNDDSVVDYLQRETSEHGGSFCVKTIPAEEITAEPQATALSDTKSDVPAADILAMVGEMIFALESLVSDRVKGHDPFSLTLKRKFIDKADVYPFLDPFADEFAYGDRKVRFDGDATPTELAHAVGRCLLEIADGYRLKGELERELSKLREHYPSAMHGFFPDVRRGPGVAVSQSERAQEESGGSTTSV